MRFKRITLIFALCLMGSSAAVAQESLGTPAAKAAFARGEALSRKSKFAEAAAEYRRAIEIDPDYAEAHSQFIFSSKLSVRDESDPVKSKALGEAMTDKLKAMYA